MKLKADSNKTISIGERLIGPQEPTYIIAEIGINHNGDLNIAKELIDVAADAKVDAVKFQKRHLPSLYREDVLSDTIKYEQNFQYMIPILQETELSESEYADLQAYSDEKGLEFICTPFDVPSAEFLGRLNLNAFKIASADLNNIELIEYIAAFDKPMLVSTGMSYWNEIEQTVHLLNERKVPFALLHCRSVYPVWPREVNLRMINKLGQFGWPVGYSGHDIGITIPLIAASMGACLIEKHITLDKKMRGPDHKLSLEAFELKRLVRDIRVADQAMGKDTRFLLRGEILNRELFGKSLMAATEISNGTKISRDMVKIQGPGKGLSPSRIHDLIGKVILRDLNKGDFFHEEDIKDHRSLDFSNSFRSRWGLISRFADFDKMLAYKPKVIEFHLTEKDFEFGFNPEGPYPQQLIVHAPEYIGDQLLDLCSQDDSVRKTSVGLVKDTVELTKKLSEHFNGQPKVVVHAGAMSLTTKLNKDLLRSKLIDSLKEIDYGDVEILFENLPPYPWYFGGQWKGNFFMDAEEIVSFCRETGTHICFDLSHAALYCNAKEKNLLDYIRQIKPYIRHMHIADAYGLDGEGVQLGQGDLNLDEIMPLFADYEGTWAPEIWRGHLQDGKGFLEALIYLKQYDI